MTLPDDDIAIETPDWSPDRAAVHREQLDAGSSMVRHPTYPFVARVRDDGNDLAPLLRAVAGDYLARFAQTAPLGLGGAAGGGGAPTAFGWLALTWGGPKEANLADARQSFWVRRRTGTAVADRSAVLLAANLARNGSRYASLGASVGVRVVLHVGLAQAGRSVVRIGSHSTSGLDRVLGGVAAQVLAQLQALAVTTVDPGSSERPTSLQSLQTLVLARANAAFGFGKALALTGIAPMPGEPGRIALSGLGQRGGGLSARVFAWHASIDAAAARLVPLRLAEQRTYMAGPPRVMLDDPASCGPAASMVQRRATRPASRLDSFRHPSALLPPASGQVIVLDDPAVRVVPTRVGSADLPLPPDPFEVPDLNPALRSDDLAASHAFVRGRELFTRLLAYGLDADACFRMAQLPLRLHHRASFGFASDGKSVNAQVNPDRQGQSLADGFDPAVRPQLDLRFGCANLVHRRMAPNNAGRARAQPLGLAADRRWAWHEFGHVLAFASTGELEFRFAHSAGDALAAIVADPESELRASQRTRYLTFPWVMLTRSHGRPAERGWCWCGQRSRLRLARIEGPAPVPGGYFEEQLMSSSLFRFYRAIGGDSGAAPGRRQAAADYAVYLVMRAIDLLGPADVVPARSADQFVCALVDADIGTGDWSLAADWPEGRPARQLHRVGGMVHKVVRWAFERQGLFATDDPTQTQEGVGLPPRVDIYVPGRQARHDGDYDPVDLYWSWDGSHPAPWHAGADSITTNGGGLLRVTVRNRGREMAQGVTVKAWVTRRNGSALDPWQPLAPVAPNFTQNIGPGGTTTFAFVPDDAAQHPLAGDYFVLAAASCTDDRANSDPAAALPGSNPALWTDPALLTDLVANDNNLGLRIVRF